MGKPNKVCAECGKPYQICYICDTTTRFSWREVACSVECYTNYLDRINGDLDVVKEYVEETKDEIVEEDVNSDKKKK